MLRRRWLLLHRPWMLGSFCPIMNSRRQTVLLSLLLCKFYSLSLSLFFFLITHSGKKQEKNENPSVLLQLYRHESKDKRERKRERERERELINLDLLYALQQKLFSPRFTASPCEEKMCVEDINLTQRFLTLGASTPMGDEIDVRWCWEMLNTWR